MPRYHKIRRILLSLLVIVVGSSAYFIPRGYYRKSVNFLKTRATPITEMFADNTLSTADLLAAPGSYYLAHVEKSISLDLTTAPELLTYEWHNPRTGKTVASGNVEGGAVRTFSPPDSGDFVLWLRAAVAPIK